MLGKNGGFRGKPVPEVLEKKSRRRSHHRDNHGSTKTRKKNEPNLNQMRGFHISFEKRRRREKFQRRRYFRVREKGKKSTLQRKKRFLKPWMSNERPNMGEED